MPTPNLLVAGNWKMNGLRASLPEIEAIKAKGWSSAVDVWLFPPASLLEAAAALTNGSKLSLGAQDCHAKPAGAFTGDLSAVMLRDAGASMIIAGHSERRSGHAETSAMVQAKAAAAHRAGLSVIVCLGETKGERAVGLAHSVCVRQLADSLPEESTPANTAVAYEPVWAIGSGVSPTPDEIGDMHHMLRGRLHDRFPMADKQQWRILYGGSVTPANAAEIFSSVEVDGVLVGGASLNASSFLAIIAAAEEASEQRKSLT